jgi:hypothetical protein
VYALRTRPPVTIAGPLDLHVLGLPLAFILSQDQTLHRVSLKTALCSTVLCYFVRLNECFKSKMIFNTRNKTFRLHPVNELLCVRHEAEKHQI